MPDPLLGPREGLHDHVGRLRGGSTGSGMPCSTGSGMPWDASERRPVRVGLALEVKGEDRSLSMERDTERGERNGEALLVARRASFSACFASWFAR